MRSLLLISLVLSLLLLSGCSTTARAMKIENLSELIINDSSISNNTTWSSAFLMNLTTPSGYTGNLTVITSTVPLLIKNIQVVNGLIVNIN